MDQKVDRTSKRGVSLADAVRAKIVRDYIDNESIGAGKLLPREKDLELQYGVSRVTVRAALRSLHDQGVVSVRNGVGAVVLPRARKHPGSILTYSMDRLASIDTFAAEAGAQITTDDVSWNVISADAAASKALRIPVGDQVLIVTRRKLIDGKPIAHIIDQANVELISPQDLKKHFQGSVLDALLASNDIRANFADFVATVEKANTNTAKHLNIPARSSVVYIDTTIFDAAGVPILWGRVWLVPEHFRFTVRRVLPVTG